MTRSTLQVWYVCTMQHCSSAVYATAATRPDLLPSTRKFRSGYATASETHLSVHCPAETRVLSHRCGLIVHWRYCAAVLIGRTTRLVRPGSVCLSFTDS